MTTSGANPVTATRQRVGVVDVAHNRFGAQRPELLGLVRRAGHAGDDVTAGDEQRDEPLSEHPGRPGEEDAHGHCHTPFVR